MRASSTPVTSGSAATARRTWLAGPMSCPPMPRYAHSCQAWPKRAGLAAASDTPAEKVNAASTPSTPATAPSRAGRTGTAARPRPGSSANRAPTTTGTPSPAAEAAAATADRRGRPAAAGRRAPGPRPPPSRPRPGAGASSQPGPRISQSALMPGCGSTNDAAPIGIHSEATMAAATPSVEPAAAASNAGSVAQRHRLAGRQADRLQDLEIGHWRPRCTWPPTGRSGTARPPARPARRRAGRRPRTR